MRDFEIQEHLNLWEERSPVERAPPDSIREKSYEPYDDGRSLPLVAYLAALWGAIYHGALNLFLKVYQVNGFVRGFTGFLG